MRALMVRPDGGIQEVEHDGDLPSLQALVGGDIEAVPYPGRDDMTCYINEQGKFLPLQRNERATELLQAGDQPTIQPEDWIAGPLIIGGFDPQTGEDQDIPDDHGIAVGG